MQTITRSFIFTEKAPTRAVSWLKALVGAFNKEKALVEAFSVNIKLCVIVCILCFKLYWRAAPLSLSPRPRLSISGNYESFDNPPLFWKTVLSKILRAENSLLREITFNGAPCWTEASKGPIVMDGLQYIIQLECKL